MDYGIMFGDRAPAPFFLSNPSIDAHCMYASRNTFVLTLAPTVQLLFFILSILQ